MKVVRTSKADPSSAVELRQRKAVLWIGEGATSNAGYTLRHYSGSSGPQARKTSQRIESQCTGSKKGQMGQRRS